MAVTEAVENYLEAILVLSRKQPDVHAVDAVSYTHLDVYKRQP